MIYSPEGYNALVQEIENQSGAMLPDACLPQDAVYEDPPYTHPKGRIKKATCGCGNDNTRFVNVYDTPDNDYGKSMRRRGGGFVTACAVCDNMGAWPRFEDAVYAADPDMDPCLDDDDDVGEPQG